MKSWVWGGLVIGAWVFSFVQLQVPPTFQPWRETLDFSRWSLAQQLKPGWRPQRDPRFPNVASVTLAGTGQLTVTVPSDRGGELRVKAQFAQPTQRLRLQVNDRFLAEITPVPHHRITRWRMVIPGGVFQPGPNALTLSTGSPREAVIIEEVTVGNVRRTYPQLAGVMLVPDPTLEKVPWSVRRAVALWPAVVGVLAAAVTWWLVEGIVVLLPWSIGHQATVLLMMLPTLLVAVLLGGVGWNAVASYAFVIPTATLLQWWISAWLMGLGLVCLEYLRKAGWVIGRHTVAAGQHSVAAAQHTAATVVTAASVTVMTAASWMTRGVSALGRVVEAMAASRILRWLLLAGIVLLALGLRLLYYAEHPWLPFWEVGNGGDSAIFLQSAVEIARLDYFLLSTAWPTPHFPLLWNVGNPQFVLSSLVGGFIKLFEFHPGVFLWAMTMLVVGSLFCLVPYAWQRLWGRTGPGGVLVGLLLATSQIFMVETPRVMTDMLATFLLAATLLWAAKTVRSERWRDVVMLSVWISALCLTRIAMMYVAVFLLLGLGIAWGRVPSERPRRWGRVGKAAVAGGLAVLWLAVVEYLVFTRFRPPIYLFWAAFSVDFTFLGHLLHGLLASEGTGGGKVAGLLGLASRNLVSISQALWSDHGVWIMAAPLVLTAGGWWACRARSPRMVPALLVLFPFVGYLAMCLGYYYFPRYVVPILLLEGILLAMLIDTAWAFLRQRAELVFSPVGRPVGWGVLGVLILGTAACVGGPFAHATLSHWQTYRASRGVVTEYLQWVKDQLPPTAIVLTSRMVDPWGLAQRLERRVVYAVLHPNNLLVDPVRLARHPFQSFHQVEEIRGHPELYTATARALDAHLSAGRTVWVLDPHVDPEGTYFLGIECEVGSAGALPAKRYTLAVAATAPRPTDWKLYRITRVPGPPTRNTSAR